MWRTKQEVETNQEAESEKFSNNLRIQSILFQKTFPFLQIEKPINKEK